ncbi:MAG: hypothetical protein H7Y88_06555 [Phycisphaerales bacterium]|nr:hypothetical protein [Phycisphaerales bacterium]
MRPTLRTALVALGLATAPLAAQDFDGDGVPDAVETDLLTRFAPVWYARGDGARPPLPIEWYVRHCRLEWYDQEYNGRSDAGDRLGFVDPISLAILNSINFDENVYYRLTFRDESWQSGDDLNDTMSWERLQNENRGVYGRVYPLAAVGCPNAYLVQFYMFFGLNSTDNPPCSNFGYHEGDVICVEFEVMPDGTGAPRIVRAVYNNHGRKAFIDSPGALVFEDGHPVVYMETGTQEPLPWSGGCGFFSGEPVPACVSTNEIFEGYEVLGWRFGAECEDFQVVREHWGEGPRLLVTNVTNLGEIHYPGSNPEAIFLERYPGLFGHYAEDRICYPVPFDCNCTGQIRPVTSPKAPRRQLKMWNREGNSDPRIWSPACHDLSAVYVNFAFNGEEFGTAGNPFNSLSEALAVAAPGGTIIVSDGATSERPNLCRPVTITVPGGSATIGN